MENDILDGIDKVLCPWKHEKPVAIIDGIEWWKDKDMNKYIEQKFEKPTREVDLHAWFVKHKSGAVFRVLTQDNKVIYETTSLEAISMQVDILVLKRGHENKNIS